MQETQAHGWEQYTVEQVLRSRLETPSGSVRGALTFRDILYGNGLQEQSMLFHWQHKPAGGFYCIYHRRSPGGEAIVTRTIHPNHVASRHALACKEPFALLESLQACNNSFPIQYGTGHH